MNYIQYMKPGSKFWALPNGLEDVSWSEFLNNWKQAIEKAKDQIIDKWENLKQDYKDAADPIAASERRQAESIEATRAKQASMKFVSDNRTDYEKKRDRKNFELKEFEQKEQLNKDATDAVMWTLTGIPYAVQHLVSPNGVVKTYGNTKAAVQNGGGPYLEKAVASAAGDVLDATILAAPLFTPEARLARAMNKNIRNTTLQPTVADEAILRGQLGWAPKQTIYYRHGSLDPELKTFVPKHDRWDVVTHGADPNMYFVTDQSTPVSAANMMDLRPYQYTGSIVAEKPMVQVGDFNIAGKNATRNQLIARARQQGADTYLLQDIVDNKVPHLNVVARFIGPEGEAVQGGAASIKWYGPTMGKTTAAKVSDKLVDIDPLLKPIRAKHAERLGLKISDPKVSADPLYKQEVADFVLDWRANPENQGKTLVASTKHLLDPQYKVEFANEPSIPDFETFAARNKARGFKETDEQLRAWYNSILELGRDLHVDNRYVSDIESGIRATNTESNTFIDNTNFKQSIDIQTWLGNLNTEDSRLIVNFYQNGASSTLEAEKIFSLFKQTNPDVHGMQYKNPQIEMLPCGVNGELIPVLTIGHLTASDLDKLIILILKKRALTFKEMTPGAKLLFINKLDEAANSISYLIVPLKQFNHILSGFFIPTTNRSYIMVSPLNARAGSAFFHESVMHYTDDAVKGLGKGLNIDGTHVAPLSTDHIYRLGGSGVDLITPDIILKTVKYPNSLEFEEIRASVGEGLRDIVSDILYYKEATPDQLINNPLLLEKLIHQHTLAGFGNAMHRNWRHVNTKYTSDYKNIQSVLPTPQKYKYADRWVNMLKYMPVTALLLGANSVPKNENPNDYKSGGKINYLNYFNYGNTRKTTKEK